MLAASRSQSRRQPTTDRNAPVHPCKARRQASVLGVGGPSVTPPARKGLGTALIKSALAHAKIDYEFQREGAVCRITLPLKTESGS